MSGKTRVCVLVAHCLVYEGAHLFMKGQVFPLKQKGMNKFFVDRF